MALDKSVFKTRAITAIVYAAVMLGGILWNEWSLLVLFSVVHVGCWYEFQKLSKLIDPTFGSKTKLDNIIFPMLGWGLMLMATMGKLELGGINIAVIGLWIVRISLFLLPAQLLFDKKYSYTHFLHSFAGFLYISLSLSLLISLRSGWIWGFKDEGNSITNIVAAFSGKLIVLVLVLSIWINDTMAYIVGSLIGKTPLTSWSPKKTWEGTVGGIVLSIGLVALISIMTWAFNYELLIVVAIAAITGTIGDLVESKLKRNAGVKDSGSFMPGHGGFLDRFDSILFATPFVWLVCYFLYR
jgi:phosphatidate cytidylyltransferase